LISWIATARPGASSATAAPTCTAPWRRAARPDLAIDRDDVALGVVAVVGAAAPGVAPVVAAIGAAALTGVLDHQARAQAGGAAEDVVGDAVVRRRLVADHAALAAVAIEEDARSSAQLEAVADDAVARRAVDGDHLALRPGAEQIVLDAVVGALGVQIEGGRDAAPLQRRAGQAQARHAGPDIEGNGARAADHDPVETHMA